MKSAVALAAAHHLTLVLSELLFLHLSEALTAIYRSVLTGLERDSSLAAASCANCGVGLSFSSARRFSRISASLASLRLIGEAFLCIELLLACGEYELVTAFLTY